MASLGASWWARRKKVEGLPYPLVLGTRDEEDSEDARLSRARYPKLEVWECLETSQQQSRGSSSSLVGRVGGLSTSRSRPHALSHLQDGAEQRCPSGRGSMTKAGFLTSLAMQGTQKFHMLRQRIRGTESSSKSLKGPLRHFPRDKWDNTDSHGACWHIAQKAQCDHHALLDPSKNAQNKFVSKDNTPMSGGAPSHSQILTWSTECGTNLKHRLFT